MTRNAVSLNDDGIIEIKVVGDQTAATVGMMGVQAAGLAAERRDAGKPVLILDDLRRMGNVPAEGRQVVVELGRTLDYDRLVMLGDNPLLRIGANLLMRATGQAGKLRYADSFQTATAWLLAFRPAVVPAKKAAGKPAAAPHSSPVTADHRGSE